MSGQDPVDEDLGMEIYKILGEVLVNAETAIELARLLLRSRYGSDELAHQEPLIVSDAGDCWAILGRGKPNFENAKSGSPVNGKAEIKISKYDGRILKFAVDGHIAP